MVRQGQIWLKLSIEGFRDPHVLGSGARTAIGFTADGRKLILANFDVNLTLPKLAEVMKVMGCYEAMNLDGGASRALAANGKILVPAARRLTNTIVRYDGKNPAPLSLQQEWVKFQRKPKHK